MKGLLWAGWMDSVDAGRFVRCEEGERDIEEERVRAPGAGPKARRSGGAIGRGDFGLGIGRRRD